MEEAEGRPRDTARSMEGWRRVERVLDQVLVREPSEWQSTLDALCSGDDALRDEVQGLLGRLDTAARFLSEPPAAVAAAMLTDSREMPSMEQEGRRIGAYRIVREIGRGGMSRVFLAERADGMFQQQVALKLLRSNLDSEMDHLRFRFERQILASLNHPNIARLLDGGVTDDGLPYLVLEHVDGMPIDRWCLEQRLDTAQRLDLFRTVALATQYAHNNLVVHRDLKPSNIFVSSSGEVKLLDFGLAKLMQQEPNEDTPQTRAGTRWMTPEYAAPEQVRGEAVTTLTDVYQLGGVLYQLLADRLPFGGRPRNMRELEDAILNEDPPPPSSVSMRSVNRDLDAIVLTALCKEPAQRYASASAMVEDIQRHRDGRPVLARAPSKLYRMGKFVRRHRASVAAGVAAVLVLAAVGVRERQLRGRAEAEARKAKAVEGYLASVFDVANPYSAPNAKPEEVSARALLDRGAQRMDSALAGQSDVQSELRAVIGHVYANLGLFDRAAPLLRRALTDRRALYGDRHLVVAASEDQLGVVLSRQDSFDRAEPLLRQALATRRRLLPAGDTAIASSLDHLGWLLQERNRYADAEPVFREALTLRRASDGDSTVAVAEAYNQLGLLLWAQARYDSAEPLYRRALAIEKARLGADHPTTAAAMQNLAQLRQLQGHFDEAETLFRQALAAKRKSLGNAHPSVSVNLNNLANLLSREKNELVESESLMREALATDRTLFGERHGYVAASMDNLAFVLRRRGRFDEAEQYYRQALDINRSLYGGSHNTVALNLNNIATVRMLRGDVTGAIPIFRQALAISETANGIKHGYTSVIRVNTARALREHGERDEAERMVRLSMANVDSARQRAPWIGTRLALAELLMDKRRHEEAQPMLRSALAVARSYSQPNTPRVAELELLLGESLLSTGRRAEAEPLVRHAWTVFEHDRGFPALNARNARALSMLDQRWREQGKTRRTGAWVAEHATATRVTTG